MKALRTRGRPRHVSACRVCGAACETVRGAYLHCQQRGRQRTPGYQWRGHETPERALERRMAEVRSDESAMNEIRAIVDALLDVMPGGWQA
jgi:hypothetical protein